MGLITFLGHTEQILRDYMFLILTYTYLYLNLLGAHLVGSSIIFHSWRRNSPESLSTPRYGRNWWPLPLRIAFYSGKPRDEMMIPVGSFGGSRFWKKPKFSTSSSYLFFGVVYSLWCYIMLYFVPLDERTKHDSIWQTSMPGFAVNISREICCRTLLGGTPINIQ